MIKYALGVLFVFFIAGCLVSAATDEDEDQMDWFKYYLDHYLGYGSTWYYTGIHAPTFDYSDMFKTPKISNIQDLLKPSGSDTNSAQSNYYQNTGFLITSSPPGANVYVNGEYKGWSLGPMNWSSNIRGILIIPDRSPCSMMRF